MMEMDLSTVDLYSIFNSSGSLKDSFLESLDGSFSSDGSTGPHLAEQCHICSEKYVPNYSAWDHSRDHAWICPDCDFTTASKEQMFVHQKEESHHGTDRAHSTSYFFCLICNDRVASSSDRVDPVLNLHHHKRAYHVDVWPSYSCQICDFTTYQESAYVLLVHEKTEHPSPETFHLRHHQCNHCKRLVQSRTHFGLHVQKHKERRHDKSNRYRQNRHNQYIRSLQETVSACQTAIVQQNQPPAAQTTTTQHTATPHTTTQHTTTPTTANDVETWVATAAAPEPRSAPAPRSAPEPRSSDVQHNKFSIGNNRTVFVRAVDADQTPWQSATNRAAGAYSNETPFGTTHFTTDMDCSE